MSSFARLALAASFLGAPAALADEPIVGNWVGEVSQGDNKFETRLTFVSARGGISRYPTFPCGGILSGDRKGDEYVYKESITWGGMDEKADGCIPGEVHITIEGAKMKFAWTSNYNGGNYSAEGELRRVKGR